MARLFRYATLVFILNLATAMAQAQSLPTDPALKLGKLPNGLTYIVRQHGNPPGRAVLWMHMHTGSLNETDAQRGLAHYLEHLAFNGSKNFPPGSVVPFYQSLGMTFGRDQNAFTSFEQTTYQLSLPTATPETLKKGMTFFADVLYQLSLLPKEIDEERQIIQEERIRGLSGQQRTMFHVLERIAPGSIYGERITIGTEKTIAAVAEADFRDYYGKWYIASNATLMVVADADPATVIAAIQESFGGAPAKPRPKPQEVGVKAYTRNFAIVASDREVRSEQVRITRVEPPRPPVTTVPLFREELVQEIGETAFNHRLQDKTSGGATSYLSARFSSGSDAQAMYMAELSGRAAPGKWKSALEELALELQRARTFGLLPHEIERAKKELAADVSRAVETEPTRPAGSLISRMNGTVTSGDTLISARQSEDLVRQLLPGIQDVEVARSFSARMDTSAVAFIAVLPASASVPTESELLEIGTKAMSVKPEPEKAAARATELMASLPQPGRVTESSEHESTGVWSGWLSNNARVHFRFLDTEKNQVTVSISLMGGELLETAANRGITQASLVAWSRPATRRLSSPEIRDLMVGKNISVGSGGFSGGGRRGRGGGGGGGDNADSVTLTVAGSPADLETGLQLAHLLLTEPKVEAAAFTQSKTQSIQMIEMAERNPMFFGMRAVSAAAYPADVSRTQPVTREQIERISEDAAQQWLDKLVRQSPLEIIIVGDLAKSRAIELATRYLGSLPARDRVHAGLNGDLRRLQRPAEPRKVTRTLKTETPQAFVMSGFYGPDENNVADMRTLSVATRILSTRMIKEVREDAQLVYSIGTTLRPGATYPGFGTLYAAAPTAPAKAEQLVEKLASMYAAFASQGPTEEELGVAKKQIANTLDEQMRDSSFWIARVARTTYRGANLDDITNAPAAYQAITREQVRETFAKYFQPNDTLVVVVKPETVTSGQ